MYRTLLTALAAAVSLFFAVSCEKPDPQPVVPDQPDKEQSELLEPDNPDPGGEELPELKDNEYLLDAELGTFASVAVSNFGEYLCIAACPAEGVEDFDAMFEQDEYFYVAISPLLNGREFDLMTEEKLYTVMSTLEGMPLENVAPSMVEEIQSGTCTFTYENGVATVELTMELPDGTSFTARISAEEPDLVVNENIFALDGNEKPIRTAFYNHQDGKTVLYLTPAGIDFFDELPITTYYAYIILADSQCHGKTLTVNDVIAVGYADNFNEILVDSNETETTGTLNVAADPDDPTHFVVSADLDFSGVTLKLRYDGNAISALVEEEVRNEIVYDGDAYPIKEAWVDMMPSVPAVQTVSLVTEDGRRLGISVPLDFMDGNAHGFSQSQDLYIEFDGKVFSKAEGYSGTVTVALDGYILTVDATNYEGLQAIYQGPYNISE